MLAYEAFFNIRAGLWDYAKHNDLIYGIGSSNEAQIRYDICKSRKLGKLETSLPANFSGPFYPYRYKPEYHLEHDSCIKTSAYYHRSAGDDIFRDVVLMWVNRGEEIIRAYVLIERGLLSYSVLDAWFDPKPDDLGCVWRKGQMNALVSKLVFDGLDRKWV